MSTFRHQVDWFEGEGIGVVCLPSDTDGGEREGGTGGVWGDCGRVEQSERAATYGAVSESGHIWRTVV